MRIAACGLTSRRWSAEPTTYLVHALLDATDSCTARTRHRSRVHHEPPEDEILSIATMPVSFERMAS
ncbi:hypothetical protein NEOLEDRAFT_55900 [Neolentinus lepideus HHB14362 ss-1]|uniref:Uncharacterized protein n=1 Tax=Neolentinus lepideus HHB14362 ss-1 TaxID=1314782 RepID=A0A165U726_9AGAM|nr:hypothetical protein NEOLEDRAFT_55900 [Neolentinus lepideus HHB14362 ss-1]